MHRDFNETETELLEEHARRYSEILKLSVAAAFAALLFILSFEEKYKDLGSMSSCWIKASWISFISSSMLGTFALSCWVVKPRKRLSESKIIRDQDGRIVRVEISGKASWYEFLSYWFHLISFAAGIVFLTIFKFIKT